MKLKTTIRESVIALIALLLIVGVAYATTGSFTPPTGTTPTNNYRTLGDIYAKLTNFSLNPSATHFVSTTTNPAGSFFTLGDIYGLLTAENARLVPNNIRKDVTIFGVTGTLDPGTGSNTTTQWSTNQSKRTWVNAKAACEATIDGSTGWRLPSKGELVGGFVSQFLVGNLTGFIANEYYWSIDRAPEIGPSIVWVSSGAPGSQFAAFIENDFILHYFRCIKP